jgi:hypothetical protein
MKLLMTSYHPEVGVAGDAVAPLVAAWARGRGGGGGVVGGGHAPVGLEARLALGRHLDDVLAQAGAPEMKLG